MFKIFEYALLRSGGCDMQILVELNNDSLIREMFKLYNLEDAANLLKMEISDVLHYEISTHKDPKVQNYLLNIRRSIYNSRYIQQDKMIKLFDFISQDSRRLIEDYYNKKAALSGKWLKCELAYDLLEKRQRKKIQKYSSNSVLLRGLVLSSPDFLDSVQKYAKKSSSSFGKSDFQTELTLLKYITRISAKTSPFSTFTNLSLINTKESEQIVRELKVKNHVRLNNYLFQHLRDLLFKNKSFFSFLNVRVNPSMRRLRNEYKYLLNTKNKESFQKIDRNNVLDLIVDTLNRSTGIPFNKFVDYGTQHVNASKEEFSRYILKLIEYGFLEFDYQISGLDPEWDTKFVNFIQKIPRKKPFMKEIVTRLRTMRKEANNFSQASFVERKRILFSQAEKFSELSAHLNLHMEGAENKSENLPVDNSKTDKQESKAFSHQLFTKYSLQTTKVFYEDTLCNNNLKIKKSSYREVVLKLAELLSSIRIVENISIDKSRMLDYFKEHFENREIDILEFYEGYYRNVQKEIEEFFSTKSVEKDRKEPKYMRSTKYELNNKIAKSWSEIVCDKFEYSLEKAIVKLYQKDLLVEEYPILPNKGNSYGAFLQFQEEKNEIICCVNNLLDGNGKYFSRFLHNFPEEVTTTQRKWNKRYLTKGKLLVENCDSSFFNANIHPPLLPYQVLMPGSNNSLEAKNHLPINKIKVFLKNDELALKYKNREIEVFDLDFQSFNTRSNLYRMLVHLSQEDKFSQYYFLINSINSKFVEDNTEKNLIIYPRIVYEDMIILQRKTWIFKTNAIMDNESLSDFEFYSKINALVFQHSMPQEVFVYINSDMREKVVIDDNYKPQYINFSSPLLVSLLRKLFKKASKTIKFVEMLPRTEDALSLDSKKTVTELLFQWYEV